MRAARGDPEAVYANSQRCRESLNGADLPLADFDHVTSLVVSIPQMATWFATL